MPWIDYERLGRSKRILVWVAVVVLALVVAGILWYLGFRPEDGLPAT